MADTTNNERVRSLTRQIEDVEDQIHAAGESGRDTGPMYGKLEDLEAQLKEAEKAQKDMRSKVQSGRRDFKAQQKEDQKQESQQQ